MVARVSCSSSSRGIAASRFRAASAAAKPSLNLLRPEARSPAAGYRSSFLSSSNNPMLRLSGVVCGASSKSSGDKVEPTFRVSGELLSSAPPALVWQVLTDYDGAASIFGNVSESRVLGPLGEHRKAEGEGGGSDGKEASVAAAAPAAAAPASTASPFLSAPFEPSAIEQHCSWKFLLFGGSFRMLLGVEEGPSSESSSPSSSDAPSDSDASAAGEGRSLVFSLLEPGFVRAFEGMWSVAVVEEEEEEGGGWKSSSGGGGGEVSSSSGGGRGGGGRRRRYRTIVKHSLGVTPAVPPPLPIRPVVRKLFQKQVAGLLDDLERELERRMKFL